jgi:uncharacterized protein (TIGR02145 family)
LKKINITLLFCIIVCGLMLLQSKTFSQPPAQPGAISGLNLVCSGQSGVEYSISAVTGADSYIWKVPTGATITAGNGSTTITVTFGSIGGNIIARGTNAECGAGKSTSFAVSVILSPTITLGTVIPIYSDSTSFNLPYSATTADKYSITAGTPALSGFIPVSNADLPLPPSSITVTVPGGNMTPDNYQFNITVTNTTTGCTSTYPFIVSILGTCPGFPTVTDIDGNSYNTIKIGTQCWMKENLKTQHYNNTSAINYVTDNATWADLNLTTDAYCWYLNDYGTYGSIYGALYNWYAVNTGILCPSGWHVPSDAEWTTLTNYLGGNSLAGGYMKEAGIVHWNSPNTGADNSSGFTALPGGNRNSQAAGVSQSLSSIAFFWSSTLEPGSPPIAWIRRLFNTDATVNRQTWFRTSGYSVRCLKN